MHLSSIPNVYFRYITNVIFHLFLITMQLNFPSCIPRFDLRNAAPIFCLHCRVYEGLLMCNSIWNDMWITKHATYTFLGMVSNISNFIKMIKVIDRRSHARGFLQSKMILFQPHKDTFGYQYPSFQWREMREISFCCEERWERFLFAVEIIFYYIVLCYLE